MIGILGLHGSSQHPELISEFTNRLAPQQPRCSPRGTFVDGEGFALQDEVVGKVINALAHALPSAKPLPRRRVTNLEAYDLFVRGRALATQSLRETRAARPLLAEAIEINPDFAGAHAWLAMSHHFDALYYGEPIDEHRAAAFAAADSLYRFDNFIKYELVVSRDTVLTWKPA